MRIYLTGAQSTGKTTLARYIADEYQLPLVSEVVRQLVAERETTLDAIRVDMNAIDALQQAIFHRQMERESATLLDSPKGFVSDRAFDFIVYTAANARFTYPMVRDPKYRQYIEDFDGPSVLVFFVRPHPQLVKADAGRSVMDLEWSSVCRIDGAIQFVLESEGIPYIPVDMLSMRDRVRLVDRVIKLAMRANP